MIGSRKFLIPLLLLGAGLQTLILLMPVIPLGVPGEWIWPRIPAGNISPEMLVFSLLLAGGYTLLWQRMAARVSHCSRLSLAGLLLVLCLLASGVMWSIRGIPQGIYGHSGLTWVTYYPRMSGYFTQATENNRTLREFLASYKQQVREGDYLHQGTHPPGLPVYFELWFQACHAVPEVKSFLLKTEPLEVAAGTNVLNELALESHQPFPEEYRAVLWGNLIFTLFLAAATLFPLFVLLRPFLSREQAWRLCGVWPFLPGLLVFLPKSDLLLPFFSAGVSACYLRAVLSSSPDSAPPGWQNVGWSLLAGGLLWLALEISLAMLIVPVILAVWTGLLAIHQAWLKKEPSASVRVSTLLKATLQQLPGWAMGGALLGLLLPCLVVWYAYDLNLLTVWQLNLHNHSRFYDHNPRTYLLWLLVNPWELGGSLGLPVGLLLLLAGFLLIRTRNWADGKAGELFSLAVLLVWGLLWLSGKNMGEAARLWIFLFPLLLAAAGIVLCHRLPLLRPHPEDDFASPAPFPWITLLFAQIGVCVVSVIVIDAFDFSYFLRGQ